MSHLALAGTPDFQPVSCEGVYKQHLQGICTNQRDAIFWSWTDVLVKTDLKGRLLVKSVVASHHGDLCYYSNQVYVAVNLGKFNEPPGQADSWVIVYDAETLKEVARHPVTEVVHGAGGMAYHDGKFLVVGGLPEGVKENYLYEYDLSFRFLQRYVLNSGHTDKGIQTVTWAHGSWWFGCYGKPAVLLCADDKMQFTGRWEFDAALGIECLEDGRFLIGTNTLQKGVGHSGRVFFAKADKTKGLMVLP